MCNLNVKMQVNKLVELIKPGGGGGGGGGGCITIILTIWLNYG